MYILLHQNQIDWNLKFRKEVKEEFSGKSKTAISSLFWARGYGIWGYASQMG